MPDSGKPEFAALEELESVVRHLSDELAMWRRRAQKAEGGERGERTEAGNADLQRRVEATRGRLQDLLKRLQFLEDQANTSAVR
jgi:hypothetical protein